MAKAELHTPFKNVRGKLNRRSNTVLRQKKYRSESGKIIGYGAQESYEVLHPRDYKRNPPKGIELHNIQSFAEASRITTLLIQAGKYTDEELAAMPEEERAQIEKLRQQLAQFKARFKAQLTTPDPQAPVLSKKDPQYNPNSSKVQRRQYRTLNTFIRALLMQYIRTK